MSKKYSGSKTAHPRRRAKKLNQTEKKQVKRLISIRQEKYFHNVYSDTTVSRAGNLDELTTIPTSPSRGVEVRLKEIRLNMHISPSNTGSPDYYNRVRVILFRWRMSSSPTAAALLQSYSSTSIRNIITPLNYANAEKYQVLHDKTYTVGMNGLTDVTIKPVTIRLHKYGDRVGNKLVHLLSGFAGSDVGGLWLFVVSDSISGSTHPLLEWESQIIYTDS